MTDYTRRMPNYLKADTEESLKIALGKISLAIGQKLEIVNIYVRGSSVVAWYFVEFSEMRGLPTEVKNKKVSKDNQRIGETKSNKRSWIKKEEKKR